VSRRAIAIVGCAVAVSASAAGFATASVSSRPAPRVITAPTASNQTVRMHVGDRLVIHLGASFDPAKSTDATIVKRISSVGGYGTNQPETATFKALAIGRASITSATDYPCLHATPQCEIAQQLWIVHVVVAPRRAAR
jgi:hypothetical protein